MALSTHVALVLSVAVVCAAGLGVLLRGALGRPPLRQAGNWTTSNSFEFAKIVLALVGGVGAVVALVVAYRKQHLGEAAERREDIKLFAERFTKASDHLGSDKAAVRLAGMYALEDLAQGTPSQRQTIVNVLCAYLRMPYLPPLARSSGNADTVETAASTAPAEGTGTESDKGVDHKENEFRHQERQVRLTAQRILAVHLRPHAESGRSSDTFWEDIDLDLTGATLVDLDLRRCHIRKAQFENATFSGGAWFREVTFSGNTWFREAMFSGDAGFDKATFGGQAWFGETMFNEDARFRETTFSGYTGFGNATFNRNAAFDKATFNEDAGFGETTFNEDAVFDEATFSQGAGFDKATFNGQAWFSKATFNGRAGFGKATFNGRAGFGKAMFNWITGFGDATFRTSPWFVDARVRLDAALIDARTWPDGLVAVEPASQDEARMPNLEGRWGYLQAAAGDDLPPVEPEL